MYVKQTILFLMLILLVGLLAAQNINLISESYPSLGEVSGFCQYGYYGLFYGGTHHLAIIDFNDPSGLPIAVFDIPDNNGRSYDLLCYNSYAYLFMGQKVFIISLQDVLHPLLKEEINLASWRRGNLIHGNCLYIATSDGYLSCYYIDNPEFPMMISNIILPGKSMGYLVAGSGFIACQSDSIYIFDISDPVNLQYIRSIAHTDSYPDMQNSQIAAYEDYLFCNNQNTLNVYSLINLEAPILISSTILDCADLISKAYIHNYDLWSLYIEGTEEYPELGVMAISVYNPSAPVIRLKQSLPNANWEAVYTGRFMSVSASRMIFNYYPYYQKTALISGSSLIESDLKIHGGGLGNIAANNDWIVGLDPFINVLDYQNDNGLFPVRVINPETYAMDVIQIKDNLLFCAYSNLVNEDVYQFQPSLDIYNLQTGGKISSFSLPNIDDFPTVPKEIQFYNDNALLSNGSGGFVCLDISDPANPSQRFRIWDPYCDVLSATICGDELWLGTYKNWMGAYLRCYDISDINNPVYKYDIFHGYTVVTKIHKIGDYLYALVSNDLICFHLGNESVLERVDNYLYQHNMEPIVLMPFGKGLLIGGNGGMQVFSLKDPLHPVETGYHALEMVDSVYPYAYYAINNSNILVANGYSLKCFDASVAGILCETNLDLNSEALQIFPNPCCDIINVGFKTGTGGNATLDIYNLRGQKLISRSISNVNDGLNFQKVSLNDHSGRKLAAGIYIVKVKTEAKEQVSKLVVLH